MTLLVLRQVDTSTLVLVPVPVLVLVPAPPDAILLHVYYKQIPIGARSEARMASSTSCRSASPPSASLIFSRRYAVICRAFTRACTAATPTLSSTSPHTLCRMCRWASSLSLHFPKHQAQKYLLHPKSGPPYDDKNIKRVHQECKYCYHF